MKKLLSLSLFIFSFVAASSANAIKLSELFIEPSMSEAGAFAKAIIWFVGIVGLILFIMAFFEYKKQKSPGGQDDLKKFYTYILVGLGLGVAGTIYVSGIESTTGQSVEINTDYRGF